MCKAVEEIAAKVGKVLTQYRLTWKNWKTSYCFPFTSQLCTTLYRVVT